ncbi:hypothetical protein GXM_02322 [Nostoc sphaeroides CCNUC1]|uniref:Uncharacterized protein n=2 Tax=Nostoc sphaeroides TaxID=446679 RepID=A0A5P8VWV1_9NOSO|nr:hypothetical protein GXM_02322 [Nostoc sphaeroides CCNUC1]
MRLLSPLGNKERVKGEGKREFCPLSVPFTQIPQETYFFKIDPTALERLASILKEG